MISVLRSIRFGGLGLSLSMFLVGVPVQAANLVLNPSFEILPAADPGGASYAWNQYSAGAPGNIPNWAVVNPAGTTLDCVVNANSAITSPTGDVCGNAEGQNWGFNFPVGPTPDGTHFFAMDGQVAFQGALAQSISGLTIGQNYTFSFYQSINQQYGYTPSTTDYWHVTFTDGLAMDTQTYNSNVMNTPGLPALGFTAPWTLASTNFTATAATETLTFLAVGTPSSSGPPFALLDNVSLTQTPAPEPGTMALLALGLVAVPAFARFRKNRS